VRIPRWADLRTVRSSLNGQEAHPYVVGRYLIYDAAMPGDKFTLEFPMVETTENTRLAGRYSDPRLDGSDAPLVINQPPQPFEYVASANQVKPEPLTTFTCRFKGNTLIDIKPARARPGLPLYRREHYKQDKVRW